MADWVAIGKADFRLMCELALADLNARMDVFYVVYYVKKSWCSWIELFKIRFLVIDRVLVLDVIVRPRLQHPSRCSQHESGNINSAYVYMYV
jgi:hypothetical protein